jgi:phospholipid/cholesterol/gamma-HCH transport system substrate-binding protein
MQKQAPSIGRILVAVGFALSCFALLLFLWVTFGGPVPFKPESYRFTADFPEAITLQKEAEVRIGGVNVGSVKQLQPAPVDSPSGGNATRATIEIDPQYAPISSDAEAILRQKTLLGETYVELTSGSQTEEQSGDDSDSDTTTTAQASTIDAGQISGDDAPHAIEEGGHLDQTQVADQTQIDEIFNGFDSETRQAFQLWMRNAGIAIDGRGLDLNDAFGNVGPFASDASDVLDVLHQQDQALRTLVRSTGQVFASLTEHDQALAGAVVGTNRTFRALASHDGSLAETFKIFPTFERESRLTLARLEDFAHNAGPVFHDLRPVARDLGPTLRDVRRLAPHARRLFQNLNPLIDASKTGLPSLSSFLQNLKPVMDGLDPFLANLNPIVRYLDYGAPIFTDFLAGPASATAGYLPFQSGQHAPLHVSRQMSLFTGESLSVYPQRQSNHRSNGYMQPFVPGASSGGWIGNPFSNQNGEIFPSHDCNNTGATGGLGSGQVTAASNPPTSVGVFPLSEIGPPPANPFGAFASCTIAPPYPSIFGGAQVPHVTRDP